MNLDYRNKNPYAIPANVNHRMMPEYFDNIAPYIPPHAGIVQKQPDKRNFNFIPYNKKPVFKEQVPQKQQPPAFTIDMGKKQVQSKVFNRLFPVNLQEEKDVPPKIPPRNFHLNLSEKPQPKTPKPNSRSIFKNYKSCPVSPVSEECKWADKVPQTNQNQGKAQNPPPDPKKRNSLSFFVGLDNRVKDSGKSIVDSIKSDTEKMIAEITRKYGDLDEYEPNNQTDLDLQPTKEVEEKDDGNFSSDSLEDCSLSQDVSCKNKLYSKKICKKHTKAKGMTRRAVSNYEISGAAMDKPTVPFKPPCISQKSSTLPRNMPSDIDGVMDENYTMNSQYNMYRCQSVLTKRCITRSNESVLSDNSNCSSVSNEIFLRYGNEIAFQQAKFDSRYNINDSQNCSFENLNEPDEHYLETHRHSSASFFLNQKKYMKSSCSQESVLSDEMYLDDIQLSRTNCNSLESVLSDDSECTKSAPLEMLFEGSRNPRQPRHQPVGVPNSKSCYEFDNGSKSYGSSPNNVSYMGGYMYNNYLGESSSNYRDIVVSPKPPVHKVYGFDIPTGELPGHKTVTRSKSLYDSASKQTLPQAKNIAYYFDGSNIQQYAKEKKESDEIPRLNTSDYMANTSKSLQPKFSEKHKYKSKMMDGGEQNTMVKSKSCSFEVVLEPASKPNPLKNLMEKRNSHVQKNLEKFEEQIRKNIQTKVNKNQLNKEKANAAKCNNTTKSLERGSGPKNNNVKITMEFVPHKPPKPTKRTSSIKMNNRLKAGLEKGTLSSSISSQYKAKLDGLQNKNYNANKKQEDSNSNKVDCTDNAEKSFDMFVKEKDINENKSEMQMDSLEVYAMQRMERMHHVSMDSLDVIDDSQNEFSKDSLDFYAEQNKKKIPVKTAKNQMNRRISSKVDCEAPCHSRQNIEAKENIAPQDTSDEVKKYKYIERKLEIINKLVEMEERKILQEKILKEWRMRPLKANINDGKGVVKVLSRKFEKLATKQNTVSNFASLTLEEVDTDTDTNSENKEIKRNLSLPDILDCDQIGGLVTVDIEVSNDAGNDAIELDHSESPQLNNTVRSESKTAPKTLPQRVYNEMVIPKTDVHLDSENYESSTTSSSCTNSPKRLSIYGFKPKTPLRKVIRMPAPRLNIENQIFPTECKIRPALSSGGGARSFCLSKKMPFQTPVLPSKFSPVQGWIRMFKRVLLDFISVLFFISRF
ncbi:putative histone-lysine N-methyltransferase 1 [Battus philenor]|uniref:putative histone-lysine N-methyltransferase 1 n=1 Tax=Battus philenor TaxID=42288 RepID=UPI0035D06814